MSTQGGAGKGTSANIEEYIKAFLAVKPKEPEEVLSPQARLKEVEELFLKWKGGGSANSAALVGNPGSAGPHAMRQLQRRFSKGVKCTWIELDRYAIAHDGLSGSLGEALGFGRAADLDGFLKSAVESEAQVVFLDRCHNLFIRRVGGFEPLFELQHVMSATRGKVLWVALWSPFTWYFLERTIGLADYFDVMMRFGAIPVEKLEKWLRLKHEGTGWAVAFGADRVEPKAGDDAFFPSALRRRFEATVQGDVEAAEAIWLAAVRPGTEKRVRIADFVPFDSSSLEQIRDEELYMLCSLLYHRDISLEYLAEDQNLTSIDTRMSLNHLTNRGMARVGADKGFFSIAPAALPAVVATLNRKNLISLKDSHGS